MTPHTSTEDNLLAAIFGWIGSFIGQIAMFGVEMAKAAVLGFVGAAAGIFARYLYKKYIDNGKKKSI